MDAVKAVLTNTGTRRITVVMSYAQAGQLTMLLADEAMRSKSRNVKAAVGRWLKELDHAFDQVLEDELPPVVIDWTKDCYPA